MPRHTAWRSRILMALPFSSLAAIDSEAPSAGTDPVLGKKFIKAVRRGSGVTKAALRFKQYGGKYGSDDELAAGLGGYKTRQERLGRPVPSTAQALGTHAATQQGDGGAVAASVGDKRSRRRSKRHSTGSRPSQNTIASPAGQDHAPQPQQRLPRVTTLQRVTAQLLQDDEEQGEAAAPSEQTAQQPASAATARVATRKDTKRLLEAATDGNLQVTRQIVESEGIAPNVKGQVRVWCGAHRRAAQGVLAVNPCVPAHRRVKPPLCKQQQLASGTQWSTSSSKARPWLSKTVQGTQCCTMRAR